MNKLDSARLLILGMDSLRPGGLTPVSKWAADAANTFDDAVDQQRFAMALTCTVLYPIVVELVVKHIWEQEHGRTAPFSHDVRSLFVQLSSEIQRDVEALYNRCCREYESAINAGHQQHGAGAVAVDMATLEEALRWNEGAVKDLKYEMTPRGQSVPTGIMWSSERIYIVPGFFPNFAIELARWAFGRFSEDTP